MNHHLLVASLAAIGMTLLAHPAAAAPVEFVIDPTASRVTVGGSFQGSNLVPQTLGSNTAAYVGSLTGDLADGKLTLYSSIVRSAPFPLPLRPGYPDPGSTQEASYGFTFQTTEGTAYGSIRQLQLYIGNEYGPPMDVSSGTFVPADAGFFVSDGGFGFELPGATFVPVVDLHGNGAPNVAAGPGTLVTTADVETLTIPLATTFTVSSGGLTLSLDGQLVATRAVPEPAAGAVLVAVSGALSLARRRRCP